MTELKLFPPFPTPIFLATLHQSPYIKPVGNKRRIIITLSALALAGILWQFLRPTEPTYEGKSLSQYLLKMARSTPGSYNDACVKAIHQMGPKAIPYLRRKLHQKNSAYIKAQLYLREHLPSALARHIPDPNPNLLNNTAIASAYCLGAFGSDAKQALPDLIDCLADPYCDAGAFFALHQIGLQPDNLPALLLLLNSTNRPTPYLAAECIGRIGVTNAAVLGALTKLVEGKDPNLSICAVNTLGHLGDKAAPTIPLLKPLLDSPDSHTRINAATALQKIQGKQAIPVTWIVHELDQELNHSNSPSTPVGLGTHEMNLLALCNMLIVIKADAQPAVDLLHSATRESNSLVAVSAAKALWEICHQTNGLVPLCSKALRSEDSPSRTQAAALLYDICTDQQLILPELTQMLDHHDFAIQIHAVRALSKLGTQSDKTLPIFTRLLEDPPPYNNLKELRCLVAETLGEMGPKANPAIPALTVALKDPDEKVRTAAAKALQQIDPASATKAGIK